MSQRKIKFVNGEIYHVIIRAVDGIKLFRDKQDYLRMIHDLFEFNDIAPVTSAFRVDCSRNTQINVTKQGLVTLDKRLRKRKRKLLVEILAFCLMPNHVHLLIKQVRENGTSRFMQKFGGYVLYYNKKYKRKGHLFQDKFKAVHIRTNQQLQTVFVYIHTNPVAIIFPGWKEKGIKDFKKARNYIENYRWSSYKDYLGKKNFPSITSREFLKKVMGEPKNCRNFVNDWLKYKRELTDLNNVAIE